MGEIGPLMPDLLFQVVDIAADFGALGAKGWDNVRFAHAPNLGAGPILFLGRLRHNTENSL